MGGLRKSQAPSSIKRRIEAEQSRLREQEERENHAREQARILAHVCRLHSMVRTYHQLNDNHSFNSIVQFLSLKDIASLVRVLVLNDRDRRPCVFVPPDAALAKLVRGALNRHILLDVQPTSLIHTAVRFGTGTGFARGVMDRSCTLALLKDMRTVIKHVPPELNIPRWLDEEEGGGVQFFRLLDQPKPVAARRSVEPPKRQAVITWSMQGESQCKMKADLPGGGLVQLTLGCVRCNHVDPAANPWEEYRSCSAVVLKTCEACGKVCTSCSDHVIKCESCEEGVCDDCHVRLPTKMCNSCGFLCTGCNRVLQDEDAFYCNVERPGICVNNEAAICSDCMDTAGNSRFCDACDTICCLPCFNSEIDPRSFQCMSCPSRLCNCEIGSSCDTCSQNMCEACCDDDEIPAMLQCVHCGNNTCQACIDGAQPPCAICLDHYCKDCSAPKCSYCKCSLCPCQLDKCTRCRSYLSCRQCVADGRRGTPTETLCKRCVRQAMNAPKAKLHP